MLATNAFVLLSKVTRYESPISLTMFPAWRLSTLAIRLRCSRRKASSSAAVIWATRFVKRRMSVLTTVRVRRLSIPRIGGARRGPVNQEGLQCTDLGVAFRVNEAGTIVGDAGRVVVVGPGRPCLACWGHLDPAALRMEALDEETRARGVAEGYIDGAVAPQPASSPSTR